MKRWLLLLLVTGFSPGVLPGLGAASVIRPTDDLAAGIRAARTQSRPARLELAGGTRSPKTRPTLDLLADRTPQNDGELAWRFGMILGCVNLVLLGIGISATNPRRASNWNLLFALLACDTFIHQRLRWARTTP